jgi:pyridoxamine 5'-phosphate oxidase
MALPLDALGKDPLVVFAEWHDASVGTFADPDSIALATATKDGRPSVRHVLLRGITTEGVRFFTSYDSRKGRELEQNPLAAIAWFDPVRRRAVRIEGTVTQLAAEESDEYFASRPRGHQLGAAASPQSAVLSNRSELERAYLETEQRFKDRDVERPERWGGYLLYALSVELWLQRDDRLHDRFSYTRGELEWSAVRIAP